jgi:two-component system response regulator
MSHETSVHQVYDIVVADDNPDHLYFFRSALAKVGAVKVLFLSDGREVIEYVKSSATPPNLIFSDLNMPVKDGFDVLRELKQNAAYRSIPIIITTSSEDELDIQKCYDLGANSYVIKPLNATEFDEIIRGIAHYWTVIAMLPNVFREGSSQKT